MPQLFFVERQVEKIDPLLDWMESEFGFKPVVYSSFFGGKQEDGLLKAVETLLKKTDDCELAAIDAIAGAAHSLTVALGLFRGKLQIEEAIELIRLEEDFQVPIVLYLSITHRYIVSLDIHLNQICGDIMDSLHTLKRTFSYFAGRQVGSG